MPMSIYHQPLSGIDKPHDNDVLCGRGVTTNRHPGNESFRSLVNCNKELYVTSTKKQKMKISRSIVEAVRSLEPPGRFLEKDQSSGKWFDIGDKKAVEKTSQALRDGAAGLRKQLSEDLSDPDFLSAVFDMEVVPPEKKTALKKGKKLPAKKVHRRTKSNPTTNAAKAKHQVKKIIHPAELAMSPRPQRHQSISMSCSMKPPPPQSPIISPRSSSGSPHALVHSHHILTGAAHRRVHSQSSVPVKLPSLSNSPVNFASPYSRTVPGVPSSNSYDYHDSVDHTRAAAPRFGSPTPHFGSSISPAGLPTSPYGMKPRSPYHPPVSPRWSPRTGYTRPGRNSLSPHPYVSTDFYRRPSPSPDRRPPVSPRDPYARTHVYLGHGGHSNSNNHLVVPALGGEQIASPRHVHPPMSYRGFSSPRNRNDLHLMNAISAGSQRVIKSNDLLLPVDFKPPQNCSTCLETSSYENVHEAYAPIDERHRDEKKDEIGDGIKFMGRGSKGRDSVLPFDEKSSSPAAVADVTISSTKVKYGTRILPPDQNNRADNLSSDEEPNPAMDDDIVSPLPFDHHEDPTSLMELPANLLSLPISPCGPNDGV